MQKYGEREEERKRGKDREIESLTRGAEDYLLSRKFEQASRSALFGIKRISIVSSKQFEKEECSCDDLDLDYDPSLPHLQHVCSPADVSFDSCVGCLCPRLIAVFMQSRFEMNRRNGVIWFVVNLYTTLTLIPPSVIFLVAKWLLHERDLKKVESILSRYLQDRDGRPEFLSLVRVFCCDVLGRDRIDQVKSYLASSRISRVEKDRILEICQVRATPQTILLPPLVSDHSSPDLSETGIVENFVPRQSPAGDSSITTPHERGQITGGSKSSSSSSSHPLSSWTSLQSVVSWLSDRIPLKGVGVTFQMILTLIILRWLLKKLGLKKLKDGLMKVVFDSFTTR